MPIAYPEQSQSKLKHRNVHQTYSDDPKPPAFTYKQPTAAKPEPCLPTMQQPFKEPQLSPEMESVLDYILSDTNETRKLLDSWYRALKKADGSASVNLITILQQQNK